MKILLIGEYSRLHNSLKEGLTVLGHEVLLTGSGDGFKNYPVDMDTGSRINRNKFANTIAKIIYRATNINLISIENTYRFNKMIEQLDGDYDIIQLYNESVVKTSANQEIKSLKKLFSKFDNVYLLSCGIDYLSVKYAFDKKFRYSILTPLFENANFKKYYRYILDAINDERCTLHRFLFKHINGVIASDIDYHLPLLGHNKYLGMMPNPINTDLISYDFPDINNKVIIFHGVNTSGAIKKGNRFFDEALEIIRQKYQDKIEIIRVENAPYSQYMELYSQCHIFLDQVYAYDQGYNALEAMARGKVVFTGAEQEWLDYYKLQEDTVAINALPDVDSLVKKLSMLIDNPDKILQISKNARAFIEREHHYVKIAQKYVDVWQNNFKQVS